MSSDLQNLDPTTPKAQRVLAGIERVNSGGPTAADPFPLDAALRDSIRTASRERSSRASRSSSPSSFATMAKQFGRGGGSDASASTLPEPMEAEDVFGPTSVPQTQTPLAPPPEVSQPHLLAPGESSPDTAPAFVLMTGMYAEPRLVQVEQAPMEAEPEPAPQRPASPDRIAIARAELVALLGQGPHDDGGAYAFSFPQSMDAESDLLLATTVESFENIRSAFVRGGQGLTAYVVNRLRVRPAATSSLLQQLLSTAHDLVALLEQAHSTWTGGPFQPYVYPAAQLLRVPPPFPPNLERQIYEVQDGVSRLQNAVGGIRATVHSNTEALKTLAGHKPSYAMATASSTARQQAPSSPSRSPTPTPRRVAWAEQVAAAEHAANSDAERPPASPTPPPKPSKGKGKQRAGPPVPAPRLGFYGAAKAQREQGKAPPKRPHSPPPTATPSRAATPSAAPPASKRAKVADAATPAFQDLTELDREDLARGLKVTAAIPNLSQQQVLDIGKKLREVGTAPPPPHPVMVAPSSARSQRGGRGGGSPPPPPPPGEGDPAPQAARPSGPRISGAVAAKSGDGKPGVPGSRTAPVVQHVPKPTDASSTLEVHFAGDTSGVLNADGVAQHLGRSDRELTACVQRIFTRMVSANAAATPSVNMLTRVDWDKQHWTSVRLTFLRRPSPDEVAALRTAWMEVTALTAENHILVASEPRVTGIVPVVPITRLTINAVPRRDGGSELTLAQVFEHIRVSAPEVHQHLVPHNRRPAAVWGTGSGRSAPNAPVDVFCYDARDGSISRWITTQVVAIGSVKHVRCSITPKIIAWTAAFCSHCYRIGHRASECRDKRWNFCTKCPGAHPTEMHDSLAPCCSDARAAYTGTTPWTCPDDHWECCNCGGNHLATASNCTFRKHANDQKWFETRAEKDGTPGGVRPKFSGKEGFALAQKQAKKEGVVARKRLNQAGAAPAPTPGPSRQKRTVQTRNRFADIDPAPSSGIVEIAEDEEMEESRSARAASERPDSLRGATPGSRMEDDTGPLAGPSASA
ncbi:hypothetical protein BDW22DRAFT_1429377 [Trametopsis cervina]|nr:hypothetical protein BDW22DRAFT_1429377 [Trametopsis cervina]